MDNKIDNIIFDFPNETSLVNSSSLDNNFIKGNSINEESIESDQFNITQKIEKIQKIENDLVDDLKIDYIYENNTDEVAESHNIYQDCEQEEAEEDYIDFNNNQNGYESQDSQERGNSNNEDNDGIKTPSIKDSEKDQKIIGIRINFYSFSHLYI